MTKCLVSLAYGDRGHFSLEIDACRVIESPPAPRPNPRFNEDLLQCLEHPLEFPPLEQMVIPDDRVTLALDRFTPESPAIVAAVWDVLSRREIRPEDVTILQPTERGGPELPDPREALPRDVRAEMKWKVHDSSDAKGRMYLASTSTGERIYLANEVVDADVVLPVGPITYDSVIGYRGTGSVLYPGMSSDEALSRTQGQGHHELGPDDERPLRQIIDEVIWLLGVQFAVQVIPSASGGVANVLAGSIDSVFQAGKKLLGEQWRIPLESRAEIVVSAIDRDARGHGWDQVGAALETARSLVARGGKIVILSELESELGPGLEIIRENQSPGDAIRPLRKLVPRDLIPATQLAGAVEWADVYLLSKLESDLVEDLFMIPLDEEAEVTRLLGGEASCLFLESAQNTFGEIRG